MNLVIGLILTILCKDTLGVASKLHGTAIIDDAHSISETFEKNPSKRSADSDSNYDYGTKCISCGKLGRSYSASASASAAASASSGGGSQEDSGSHSIPTPSYRSTYNTYPRQHSYSQFRKSSSYGNQNEHTPVNTYPQSGSSSSYSSSSRYHSLPHYSSVQPKSTTGQSSQSSYYHSQSGSAHAQPSYNEGDGHYASDFDKEISRMRQSMEDGSFSSEQYPYSTGGGSHRSEYSSESRYVNGKQVYDKKAEKRYKDGKVVHDFSSEKGPEELGTKDALVSNIQPKPYESSHAYSRQYDQRRRGSVSPTSHSNYLARPKQFRPMSKETYYSERRSSSHQPFHREYMPATMGPYSQGFNTHGQSSNAFTSGYENRAPSSTHTVENSYEENKVISHSPQHYAPAQNTVSKESVVNITRSSKTNTDRDHTNTQPTFLNNDHLTDYQHTKTYPGESESSSMPYNTQKPNAYQSLTTSYNKEARYSSGTDNTYDEREPEGTSDSIQPRGSSFLRQPDDSHVVHQPEHTYRQPYEPTPSISSESSQNYNSITQQTSANNDQRYDISPYHDDQQTRAAVSNYSPQGIENGNSSESSHYYQKSYLQNSGRAPIANTRINNYNSAGYTQSQNKFGSAHYRAPTYTRLPSRWLETRTTYKYFNGKLIGETRYNKLYEDGVLINQNITERTREQMANEGIDVLNLDLKLVPVNQPATITSQEEVRYVQELTGNSHQPIIRTPNYPSYQPSENIVENSFTGSEASFVSGNTGHLQNGFGREDLRTRQFSEPNLFVSYPAKPPKTSVHRHEVYEEEEFVNGEKTYDLHHERKFKDNKLVHENKTELLPDDLGVKAVNKSNSYFTSQQATGAIKHLLPISNDHSTSSNAFRTSCLSCSTGGVNSLSILNRTEGHKTVSLHNPLGSIITGGQNAHTGTSERTFREDVDIEEHYENGRLVRGQEENKKWKDGRLIDSNSETYHAGPSRTSKFNLGMGQLPPPQEYSHRRRQRQRDTCAVNPCQNGATCRKTASSSSNVCLCTFGFNGNFCENAYCPSRFCRYGGSCSITNNHHICACQEGFTGYRCKTRVQSVRMAASG